MFECYGQIKITVNESEWFTVCLNQHFWWKQNLLLLLIFWMKKQTNNMILLFSPQSGGMCWYQAAAFEGFFLVTYRLDKIQIILRWHLQLNKARTNKSPLTPNLSTSTLTFQLKSLFIVIHQIPYTSLQVPGYQLIWGNMPHVLWVSLKDGWSLKKKREQKVPTHLPCSQASKSLHSCPWMVWLTPMQNVRPWW